ncbi:Hypothetical predicted protein [Olea europaea subsp. europaea]|uniref:Uncharacterized protein n=1 Tax=Olea europaea subsp. europaea TaxID=158383 RepID=A0A8S0UT26_OLEEU|nr:Hypothetical predicted protein [Olea europaea subsp. europaea]
MEIIAKEISGLKPEDAGKYVQLAHSFTSMARWDGVGKAWLQMNHLARGKLQVGILIEMHGTITTFFSPQSSHPQYEDSIGSLAISGCEYYTKRHLLLGIHIILLLMVDAAGIKCST